MTHATFTLQSLAIEAITLAQRYTVPNSHSHWFRRDRSQAFFLAWRRDIPDSTCIDRPSALSWITDLLICTGTNYKEAVLSQIWPRDAPTKVNKQPHLHLRSR